MSKRRWARALKQARYYATAPWLLRLNWGTGRDAFVTTPDVAASLALDGMPVQLSQRGASERRMKWRRANEWWVDESRVADRSLSAHVSLLGTKWYATAFETKHFSNGSYGQQQAIGDFETEAAAKKAVERWLSQRGKR